MIRIDDFDTRNPENTSQCLKGISNWDGTEDLASVDLELAMD